MADGDKLESRRVDEAAARRILERATELDARLATESTVGQLREAARDAGISEEAFSRALAEVQDTSPVVAMAPPVPASITAKRVVKLTLVVLVALGAMFAGMRLVSNGGADAYRPSQTPRAVAPVGEPPAAPESRKATKKTGPVAKKITPVAPVPPG